MRRAHLILVLAACGDASDETSTTGSTTADATSTSSSTDPVPTTGEPDDSTSSSDESSGDETTASTGPSGPLMPDPGEPRYALIGEVVVLDGSKSSGAALFQWDPGDGSPPADPSTAPVLEVSYAEPGRYKPILTVFDGMGQSLAAGVTITATDPPVWAPRHSTTW
jgi:hypothetical protein